MTAPLTAMRSRGLVPGGRASGSAAPSAPKGLSTGVVRLLAASAASYVGDWLTTVAMTVMLYGLLGPAGPAAYMIVRVAPRPLGSLLGGRITDHAGARRTLLGFSIVQGICGVAIIAGAQQSNAIVMLAAAALAQLCGAAASPARLTLLLRLSAPDRVTLVSGWHSALASASVVIAPPLGAALLLVVSAPAVIAIDVLSFFAAGAAVASIRVPIAVVPAPPPQQPRVWRVLATDSLLRGFAMACFLNFALITALQSTLVVIAHDRFGASNAVGVLYAAVGAGSVAGSLMAMRRPPRRVAMPLAALMEGVAVLAFTVTTWLPLAALCLAVCGGTGAAYQVGGSLLISERVPARCTGGVSGAIATAGYMGMLAGAAFAGSVLTAGAIATVQILGITVLALLVLVTLAPLRLPGRSSAGTLVTMDGPAGNETRIPSTSAGMG